jgi:tetratricopeptide (TPR) repeat protein
MGQTFNSMGRPADAIAEFRAALEAETDFPEARTNLGRALADSGDPAAGIAELRKALQTKKKFPEAHIAHTNLGNALLALDRRPEAIAAYQDALRVNPKYADAYYGLGNAYFPGKPADAVDAYRRAIELNPNDGQYHNNLGNALAVSGDLEGAIAEFREALGLDKDLSQAHHNLGRALLENGQFNEAVAEYRVAVQLQKDNAEWREHLRQAEEMTRLDDRLPVVLAGKDKPADGAQALAFAHLCQLPLRGQNVAAARFFGEAFDRDPKLAENLETGDRYNAACAAALAAAGKGKDAGKLDDNERARLRQQALDWLRADLAAWRRVIDQEPQKAPTAAEVLRHWLDDTDFAAVRGKEALAKLREAERKAWQKLWDDATGMRKRSAETPAKKQPEPK